MNDGHFEERRHDPRRARDRELEQMSKDALERAIAAQTSITQHEALCALRYEGIAQAQARTESRMDALIKIGVGILLGVSGTTVLLLVTLVLNTLSEKL